MIPEGFIRVTRSRPCPVCGRVDWCLIGLDDPPSRAVCARVESPQRWGEAGWLHRLADDITPPRRPVHRISLEPQSAEFRRRLTLAASRWAAEVEPERLERFAADLGLSVASLQRLGVGWASAADLERFDTRCRSVGAWTWPMRDAGGEVVGVRLRSADGFKWAIRDGRQGLFLPEMTTKQNSLLVCEGPTDCAAMLDLGFEAVGRPSCSSGVKLLVRLIERLRPADVVLVADADTPGQRGAQALGVALLPYVGEVRTITPPAPSKDARAWRQAGATRADVQGLIDAAPVARLGRIVRREVVCGK